ncbi:MAG: hypothetical protein RBU45_23795, partial [Myxococcota bacterium]|nr:hypothetical protein [Myxococcota bacterium]
MSGSRLLTGHPRWTLATALATGILLLGSALPAAGQVVDSVIPVPYRPHDPKIPHYAYNYHPTTFKAISRGGCAAGVNDQVLFRWHFDNEGIGGTCDGRTLEINGAKGKWYKDSRYNLGCRYQIPYVDPNDSPKKLFVGTVEVACIGQVNADGSVKTDVALQPLSKRASYYVTVFAQVPVGRPYNASGLYGYTSRPIPSGTPTCTNGKCANLPSDVTIACDAGRHDQCVGDTDEDLAIKRAVVVDDSLWYLHTKMVRSGEDTTTNLTTTMPNDGAGYTAAIVSLASSATAMWGMVQNGYAAAYPVKKTVVGDTVTYTQTYDHNKSQDGIQAHPDATWTANNTMHWNNSPYAEDVIRFFNHILGGAFGFGITNGIDDDNTMAGTSDDQGLWWYNAYDHNAYVAGPCLGAVATSGLAGTVAQVSCGATDLCLGKKVEYIVQQAVDGSCERQNRSGKTHSWDGSWCYSYSGQCADLSTAQWVVIGLEAAEQAMKDSGVRIPAICKERLPNLLWYSSLHTAGDYHGSGRYRNTTACTNGCSLDDAAKDPHLTGGLLVGHGWLGSDQFGTADDNLVWSTNTYSDRTKKQMRERYDAAMTFLGKYWYVELSTGTCWTGSLFNSKNTRFDGSGGGYLYALYSVMKGLRTLSSAPKYLRVDTNGDKVLDTDVDWWRDMSYYLINNQHKDGYQKQLKQSGTSSSTQAGVALSTSWGGVLTNTATIFDPDPVAVAEAVSATTVDEGCQGAAFGKVTFQHKDSYHLSPKRKIVEYQWLFETVAAPTNATFDAVPWGSVVADAPDLARKAYKTASKDAAPIWQYLAAGTYHAALRVKDDSVDASGNPAPKYNIYVIKNVIAQPQPAMDPIANARGPYEIIEGSSLSLAGTMSDPNTLCRADALT